MSSNVNSTAIETNPPILNQSDVDSTVKSVETKENDTNNHRDTGQESRTAIKISDTNDKQEIKAETSDDNNQDNSDNKKNESSNLSTAFTISFEDSVSTSNNKKLFGIRDSIRKFAPPKPNTIEKPRPHKGDSSHDNSYFSIESAPGSFDKHSLRRELTSSNRSSSRKSDSSRHSNISDSAAFLIDKMLASGPESSKSPGSHKKSSSSSSGHKGETASPSQRKKQQKQTLQDITNEDILDDELDFSEDKSDNGTYIVGADPESDAARRKIDELFGVVKAAQASVLSNSSRQASNPVPTRQSRVPNRNPLSRERQEHINRLATGRMSSRSSSSSRPDTVTTNHRSRAEARHHSRNSSCDRLVKPNSNRPRRAASQSSRHSSNRDASDQDTRSSRSSLHQDIDVSGELQPANNPSMKFNRAFALRRARLGLGEPSRPQILPSATSQIEYESLGNVSLSPRRNLQSHIGGKPGSANSSNTQNLSRNDGGRFSLRMKHNNVQARLNAIHGTGRVTQHGNLIDSYISKVSNSSRPAGSGNVGLVSSPGNGPLQSSSQSYASTLAYQSGDELEASMSSSRYRFLMKSARLPGKRNQSDLMDASDADSTGPRFNYSSLHGDQNDNGNYNIGENQRASSSIGNRRGSSFQLGALDSLVISAISGLSLKIRGSVCDLMVEHAKRLPSCNETRSVVEEIMPQLTANATRPKSPTSIEEIDQSLCFDLAQTLKNLKKVEQMVDVMKVISKQLPSSSPTNSILHNSNPSLFKSSDVRGGARGGGDGSGGGNGESNTNSESASLSPS